MIEFKNLTYIYQNKTKALDDVSFKFNSKGLYYIIGESGSGKSTLLNCLGNILTDYQGNILYKGKQLNELSTKEKEDYLRSEVSICTQLDYFEEKLSVMDNLMISLNISDISKNEKLNRINYYADKLLVKSLLNKKVNKLSGGELKRMNILRTLIKQTNVILLDEPISNLDEENRIRITSFFEELAKSKLVIIITHNTENIKLYTSIITLKDGKISDIKNSKKQIIDSNVNTIVSKRKQVSIITNIVYCIKCLLKKGRYFSFSLFSTSIALTSIGLIILLTNCVNLSLNNMLKTTFTNNTMLVKMKNNNLLDSNYKSATNDDINYLKNKYKDYIIDSTYYYDIDFENVFINSNNTYFTNGKNRYQSTFSSRDFVEFTYYKEIEELQNYSTNLLNDEIILGLNLETLYSLCNFYKLNKNIPVNSLNGYLLTNKINLYMSLENSQWSYNLENIFSVKRFVLTKSNRIIHTSSQFAKYFVEDLLYFSTYTDLSYKKETPWCYFKAPILILKPSLKEEFFLKIEEDSNCNLYLLLKVNKDKMPRYFNQEEDFSLNRYIVYIDYKNNIKVSSINKMFVPYFDFIDSILYSDQIYYCSDEGMLDGFLKPIYVSNKKDLLNKISDYNYQSEFDLQGFQGSSIVFDKGVIMGDLSNTSSNPLRFKSYINKIDLKYGKLPSSFKEVLISSNLAKELFLIESDSIDKTLYLSMLTEIIYKDDGYKNIFKEGDLKISGIVESENNFIYQKPRFLSIISQEMFNLNIDQREIDKVIVNFKQDKDISLLVSELKQKYDNYEFSIPYLTIKNSVNKIINYIGLFLYGFAAFSSIIAFSLLVVIIYLFIKEDNNKIFIMKLNGYSSKDIFSYYCTMNYIMGILAFVFSTFNLFICSKIFSKQLSDLIGDIDLSIYLQKISFINLLVVLVIDTLSCILMYFSLSSFKSKIYGKFKSLKNN